MLTFISISAGLLLIIVLCTEEFRRGLAWARATLEQRPHLKPLAYPLAVLLSLATGLIIVNALISLILSLTFSYE
jgi:hypothetical protein